MKEFLFIIKNDFPDKAMDIYDSLIILKKVVNSTMSDINGKMSKAFEDRNFSVIEKYSDLAKQAYKYENQLEEIIEILNGGYIIEKTINETNNINWGTKKMVPNYEDYKIDSSVEHSLDEDFTHIRPYGFKFLSDEIIHVRTWREMLIKTSEILLDIDEQKFLNFENLPRMNGKKRKHFSKRKGDMRNPAGVKGKIYLEANMDSNGLKKLVIKLLREYGYTKEDYKVYFAADYTDLNDQQDKKTQKI